MAKINIYIPDELKARMDKAGDINWSLIARKKFERELKKMVSLGLLKGAGWKKINVEIEAVRGSPLVMGKFICSQRMYV